MACRSTVIGLLMVPLLAAIGGGCGSTGRPAGDSTGATGQLVRAKAQGRLIAFTRNRSGHTDVFVLNLARRSVRRLTRSPRQPNASGDRDPDWSPSGKRIVFVAGRNRGPRDREEDTLMTIRTGGGRRIRLTKPSATTMSDPTWSPNGQFIAVSSLAPGADERESRIQVLSVADKRIRRIGPTLASEPAWSPDGRALAFTRGSARGGDLWVMERNGRSPHKIATDATNPAWSPDGKQIVFESGRDNNGETCFDDACHANSEVYSMNADGTGQRRLTSQSADDGSPSWSPDGRWVVFASERREPEASSYQLYVMSPAGRCVNRLISSPDDYLDPSWQPARRQVPYDPRCG